MENIGFFMRNLVIFYKPKNIVKHECCVDYYKKNFIKLGNIWSAGSLNLKKLIKFFVDHLG